CGFTGWISGNRRKPGLSSSGCGSLYKGKHWPTLHTGSAVAVYAAALNMHSLINILLGINVLSEVARATADTKVVAWLTHQPLSTLFTTTITRGEILYGVHVLPRGRRRDQLQHAIIAIFNKDFAGRNVTLITPW